MDFWSKAKFVVAVVWKQRDKVVAGGSCKKSGAERLEQLEGEVDLCDNGRLEVDLCNMLTRLRSELNS